MVRPSMAGAAARRPYRRGGGLLRAHVIVALWLAGALSVAGCGAFARPGGNRGRLILCGQGYGRRATGQVSARSPLSADCGRSGLVLKPGRGWGGSPLTVVMISAAMSRSLRLRFWEAWRSRSKAVAAVQRCCPMRIPTAWSMTLLETIASA